ncbi:hypothetical protein [Amycolatopsis arida]|uniref:hypothetical protein n=1 Tax=Amycolatopsis arida TaxID=587909 RepID=UPI0010651BB1|nr:hypothetical protein [Amycolatopsis arida]TDX84973.1 hypothetical protein CLV69_11757 [Amycolatopsis arida]
MTRTWEDLPNPPIPGLDKRERTYLAYELEIVAIAARERAAVLYAGAGGRAALAIHELTTFADRVQARAERYKFT